MLVLGLDTSSPAVSVGLYRLGSGADLPGPAVAPADVDRLAESVVVDGRRHGELLALGVRDVLAQAGADRRDLGAVVVGLGPGPFTGLRVGLVTAAALADALDIPAYGGCSLDAMADATTARDGVVVVTDARRKEVYWAQYDHLRRCVAGPAVDRPDVLAERLRAHGWLDGDVALVGAGAVLHEAAFAGLPVAAEPLHPEPYGLVLAAAGRVLRRDPSGPLTPLYLRRPDAAMPGAVKRVTA